MSAGIGSINIVIVGVYLLGMLLVGLYFSRRQKNTDDFYLAGRSMHWLPVAMSMFASLTSAVTYIGVPASAFGENISLVVVCVVSPIVAPLLIRFFYPFYRRARVTTSYEYIDKRFGSPARFSVSALFLLARLGWLGTVVYAPSLALSAMTGMPLWSAITAMGVLATAYTVLGGLAADIWTDVIQFVILVAGAVWVAAALTSGVPQGAQGILAMAAQTGRLHVFDWKLTLFGMSGLIVAISFFFQLMQDYGTDQVTVQRLLAIRDLRGTARAVVFNALTDLFLIALLLYIGLGLHAYYQADAGALPPGISADRVLPHFIIHQLPAGVSGLLISAILAAAMSSMDSGINSLATVIANDVLKPPGMHPAGERAGLNLARAMTLGIGVLATLVAFYVSTIEHIVKAFATFMSLFNGPVLALFVLGIFTLRGSFAGWIVGAAAAIPATLWLQHIVKAHWVYYFPFSFGVCLGAGYLASRFFAPVRVDASLTVWDRSPAQPAMAD